MFPRINRFLASSLLTAAAVAAVPSVASADHRFEGRGDDRSDWRHDDRHDDHRDALSGHFDIRIGGGSYERIPPVCPPPVYQDRVWVEPVYRTCTEQVLVPATYTTVCDRVWVEPVVQRTCERVWIGDRYENRDITHWEFGRRVTRCERVLVEAGHYADVPRDVVTTPGHYEDRPRQQLVEAHYETVTRQEVVVPGHYEAVTRVAAAPVYHDSFSFGLRIPFGH